MQPIVLPIVGMAQNSMYPYTTAGQSGGGSGGSGSNVYGMAGSLAQQYATNKLMSGATSAFGDTINGWAASAFPNTFASSAGDAAINTALNNATLQTTWINGTQPTNTFTGSMGATFNPWNVGAGFAGSALANYVIAPALHATHIKTCFTMSIAS